MVNFVAFHAKFDSGPPVASPKQERERIAANHSDLLDMLGQSALLTQDAPTLTLLANDCFEPGPNSPFAVRRVSVDQSTAMLDRSRAQKSWADAHDFSEPIVFLDTDMLLNRDLAFVFEQDFDIGLTWRPHSPDPVNGGLILVNNRRPDAARSFFAQFVREFEADHADQARWFGDQASLRQMLEIPAHGTDLPPPQRVGEALVTFFPCEVFNFTPVNHPIGLAAPLDDKVVLHFKGPRKWMMYLYWEAYLAPRGATPAAEKAGVAARERIAAMVKAESPALAGEG